MFNGASLLDFGTIAPGSRTFSPKTRVLGELDALRQAHGLEVDPCVPLLSISALDKLHLG